MEQTGKVILAYVNGDAFDRITETDAKMLTHINTAFGNLDLDGNISTEHLKLNGQIARLKAYNPKLKISLSLVPSHRTAFSRGSATTEGRRKIAASCAKAIKEQGFDGVDLDWEFPCCPSNGIDGAPEDRVNFTLLCQTIRVALDGIDGRHYLFTIASGADRYFILDTEMDKVQKYLDYVCLMTYDLRCGFHALTGHHTNLYNTPGDIFANSCDTALRLYVVAGVPKKKLLMGAAFYSRIFENVNPNNNRMLQVTNKPCDYGPPYQDLAENYINKNGYVRYWDNYAKAPTLFNGKNLISYDDPQSVGLKCDYINSNGYAGIFYWNHIHDNTKTLLSVMHDKLK